MSFLKDGVDGVDVVKGNGGLADGLEGERAERRSGLSWVAWDARSGEGSVGVGGCLCMYTDIHIPISVNVYTQIHVYGVCSVHVGLCPSYCAEWQTKKQHDRMIFPKIFPLLGFVLLSILEVC